VLSDALEVARQLAEHGRTNARYQRLFWTTQYSLAQIEDSTSGAM